MLPSLTGKPVHVVGCQVDVAARDLAGHVLNAFGGIDGQPPGVDRVGTAGRPIRSGQLVVMGAGDWFEVRGDDHQDSRSPTLELLVLSGKPIGEHVEMYGPFVIEGASTRVTPSRLSEIETQGSYDAAGRARDCSASRRSSTTCRWQRKRHS